MKLTYIAHGWSLGLKRGALFSERIEAWKYGPVIPDLYHATKRWGRDPIPLENIEGAVDVDQDTEDFLEDVFQKYGHMNGIALSALTHKPGTPWHDVYEQGVLGIEIPDALIEKHYEKLLNERSSRPPAR